jgi:hypothetical protein
VDCSAAVCYHRATEETAVVAGSWRWALVVGLVLVGPIAAAAADEQYVIWRSSALGGFDWQPSSRAYASKEACDEAIQARTRRIARALDFLRRIGADDTIQRAVGDRIYECRPALPAPPSEPSRGGVPQSP